MQSWTVEQASLSYTPLFTFTEPDETAPPTILPKHTTDQPKASDKPKLNQSLKTPHPGNSTKPRPETAQGATKNEKSRSGFPISHTLKQKLKLNATSPRISASYVAPADRGVELTFAETGKITVFMMVRGNAFIQLDGEAIPTFQLRWVENFTNIPSLRVYRRMALCALCDVYCRYYIRCWPKPYAF